MNMQVLLQLRRTGVFQRPASLCLLGEASEVPAIHDLGEARVDNRKISKMRQNHAKTLRCKRCLVLAAPWIRSQSIRKGGKTLNAISDRVMRFGSAG
jgi:hypothetical protein